MSLLLLGFIAFVILGLVTLGIVVGWVIGTNDSQLDILAKRLAAEQRIEAATRDTLRAMRDAVRRRA